uniref:Uncharacterized protein n=1 Tax=Timema genevievae TaxID=629358 RepID=A0A7R9K0H1_TIMGE|nr:unnamed protein product [Timema genevievae]
MVIFCLSYGINNIKRIVNLCSVALTRALDNCISNHVTKYRSVRIVTKDAYAPCSSPLLGLGYHGYEGYQPCANSFHISTEGFPLILLQDTMRAIFPVSTGHQLDQTALDNTATKAVKLAMVKVPWMEMVVSLNKPQADLLLKVECCSHARLSDIDVLVGAGPNLSLSTVLNPSQSVSLRSGFSRGEGVYNGHYAFQFHKNGVVTWVQL